MDLTVEVTALRDLLAGAQTIVIFLPEHATRDAVASGLGLYLSLTQMGKSVTIVYPKSPIVGWSHLVGLNKLTTKLGNKNFVISLDYKEGSIEKVSYNIEGDKFNLVIEPRTGAPLLSQENVTFGASGMSADLLITVEVAKLENLGKYYTENKATFEQKPVVVIDNKTGNTQYGKVNVVRPSASIAELVTRLINDLQLPFDGDIASNLYDGLVMGSRTFSSQATNADTFEMAAYLLRAGARKAFGVRQQEERPKVETGATAGQPEAPQTPPDWLKPKIYKGSQLL